MWVPVDIITSRRLVEHARSRGRVRLVSGRIATLVSWPYPGDRVGGLTCRLETLRGTQWRVHIREVESIDVPEPETTPPKGTPRGI